MSSCHAFGLFIAKLTYPAFLTEDLFARSSCMSWTITACHIPCACKDAYDNQAESSVMLVGRSDFKVSQRIRDSTLYAHVCC